jgi:hypothetical protein
MGTDQAGRTGRILVFCALLLAKPSASQMPAPLGRLHITSTTAGASISVNNVRRKEVTPVTLAVVPGTYSVAIDACPPQSVSVGSGETKEVACEK